MSIGDVIKLVDVSRVDEKAMVELVGTLRDAFQQWVRRWWNWWGLSGTHSNNG